MNRPGEGPPPVRGPTLPGTGECRVPSGRALLPAGPLPSALSPRRSALSPEAPTLGPQLSAPSLEPSELGTRHSALGTRRVWALERARIVFGLAIIALVTASALLAPWLSPQHPETQVLQMRLAPPGRDATRAGRNAFGAAPGPS